MHVRSATPADLPAICAIYNEAVLTTTATADYHPQTLEQRTVWFHERTGAGYPVLVAEDTACEGTETEIAGWAALNPHHMRFGYRFTVENSIYVAEARRGSGIGKLLLEPLITIAQTQGYHAILAGISGDNEASLRLHAALGFERVAQFREIVFKFDRWLDVIYMERLLTSEAPQP